MVTFDPFSHFQFDFFFASVFFSSKSQMKGAALVLDLQAVEGVDATYYHLAADAVKPLRVGEVVRAPERVAGGAAHAGEEAQQKGYQERLAQISMEMLFVFSNVKQRLTI